MSLTTLAQAIPRKVRKAIYSILGTLVALEAIFDVIEPGWESKIMAALVVLGFGGAALNTRPSQYNGAVNVLTDETGGKIFSLELNGDPTDIEFMDEVKFKVQK